MKAEIIDGIETINRKEVEWEDPGKDREPYLVFKIGDVELLEKLIHFMSDADPAFAIDIESEYKELDKARAMKTKEYGNLPVPRYIVEFLEMDLEETFMNPYTDEECTAEDVQDKYDEYQKKDWDLPMFMPDDLIKEVVREVNNYVTEQKSMEKDNEYLLREYYASVL